MTSFQDAPDENIELDEKMELRSDSDKIHKKFHQKKSKNETMIIINKMIDGGRGEGRVSD